MPSRRKVLAGAGTAFLPLASGCLGSLTGGDGPGTGTETVTQIPQFTPDPMPSGMDIDLPEGPRSLPELPDELSEESVETFIEAAEHAIAYNTLDCGEYDGEVSVFSPEGSVIAETRLGFLAVGSADGGSTCQREDHTVSGHLGRNEYPYLVAEKYATRITQDNSISGKPDGTAARSGPTPLADIAFDVVNFDGRSHEISITVAHGPEVVFERTFSIGARTKVTVEDAVYAIDPHEITVETAAGARSRGRWSEHEMARTPQLVNVLPTGEVLGTA